MESWQAEVEEYMDWRQQQELDEEYEAEMMAQDIRRTNEGLYSNQ